ncbi:MAG: hypothetical protein E6969_11635, partial [Veillonella sp.]|nr:hypothetical protein [Veillonella sp.]
LLSFFFIGGNQSNKEWNYGSVKNICNVVDISIAGRSNDFDFYWYCFPGIPLISYRNSNKSKKTITTSDSIKR